MLIFESKKRKKLSFFWNGLFLEDFLHDSFLSKLFCSCLLEHSLM